MSLFICSVSFTVTGIFLLGCMTFLNNIHALIPGQSACMVSLYNVFVPMI